MSQTQSTVWVPQHVSEAQHDWKIASEALLRQIETLRDEVRNALLAGHWSVAEEDASDYQARVEEAQNAIAHFLGHPTLMYAHTAAVRLDEANEALAQERRKTNAEQLARTRTLEASALPERLSPQLLRLQAAQRELGTPSQIGQALLDSRA